MINLNLTAHESFSYNDRTQDNASRKYTDLTIAFAVDFKTAGEHCTMSAAGNRYLPIPFEWDIVRAANHIRKIMYEKKATRLNIAGNGIYTLVKHDVDQHQANEKVYEILKEVLKSMPITEIRSGGQTGIDHAGLVAGVALGIPTYGLYPRGYRRRNELKEDFKSNPFDLMREIKEDAGRLNRQVLEGDGGCHCHTRT